MEEKDNEKEQIKNNIIKEDEKIEKTYKNDNQIKENNILDNNISLEKQKIEKDNKNNEINDMENIVENKIYEKLSQHEEQNNNNKDLNQRDSDPENYEIEREFSIENINKINQLEENVKINEIKIPIEIENLKCNKEYNDNNDNITGRRFSIKNNNNKYLIIKEEEQNNPNSKINDNNNSDNEYESDREDEEKKEDLFPFRIIGDAKKKSQKLGVYNNRYLEIDSKEGLFKRYKSIAID